MHNPLHNPPQTANYYHPKDIALAMRINMEEPRGYTTRELLPFAAKYANIAAHLPDKQRSIALGLWLKRNLLGRPFDGWTLTSWIGEYNFRLYRFVPTDRPDDATGLHAEQLQRLRELSGSLRAQRARLASELKTLDAQIADLDSVIASVC